MDFGTDNASEHTPPLEAPVLETHVLDNSVLSRIHKVMQLREEIEALGALGPFVPEIDWQDSGEHLTLVIDVPGCTHETLHLEHEESAVIISGKREEAQQPLRHRERKTGRFMRRIPFPEAVLIHSAEAQVQAGVLSVRFEKVHKTIEL